MSTKMDEQAPLALLRELAIDSQWVEHPVIASIEEYYAQGIGLPDQGIKNLFLRNRKDTRHYLVLLDERKEIDLPGITEQTGESRLSFASVERPRGYLGVGLGCVMPFALVNDPQHKVEVLLDDATCQDQLLGFHPLMNTVTECVRYADLLTFLVHTGHEPRLTRVQAVASHLLAPAPLEEVVPAVAQRADFKGLVLELGFQPQASAFPVHLVQVADPRQAQVAAGLRLFRRIFAIEHSTPDLDEVNQMVQRIVVGEGVTVVDQLETEAELLGLVQAQFPVRTVLARLFYLPGSEEFRRRLPGQPSQPRFGASQRSLTLVSWPLR